MAPSGHPLHGQGCPQRGKWGTWLLPACSCLQLFLAFVKQKHKQVSVRAIHSAKLRTDQGPGKAINYCDLKSSNSEPWPRKPEQMPCLNQRQSPLGLQVSLCLSRLLCFQCLAGKSKQTVCGVHLFFQLERSQHLV